ncbi:hypothetical protein R1sor_011464 [Riccia sorocarpa]|uniref:Pentatricopeptide repeat-containing protein n=1 Tax=Riccia sorocarpa TaxID=122646 RepID=A0ABD3I1B7_9MARC
MAGRLAGRSNASLCKRLLGRSHVICVGTRTHPENPPHQSSRNEKFSEFGRFGSGRGVSSLSYVDVSSSVFQLSASPRSAYVSVKCLNGLQETLGGRCHAFSTIQGLDSGSKDAAHVVRFSPGDLHLPKLVNPTSESVKKICGILEKRNWGPETVKELEEADVQISPYLVQLIVLQIAEDEYLAWNFFMWARGRANMSLSLRAYIALVDSLGRAKNVELLKQGISLMNEDGHRASAWPYNNILKWFSDDVETALHFWGLMKENKCRPTVITYTRVIDILAKHGRIQAASETFKEMLEDGCPPNITTYNVLIQAFGAAGQLEAASDLFDKLAELGCKPNYETYNALITMHADAGNMDTAMKYFNLLKSSGAEIGEQIYRALELPLPDDSSSTESLTDRGDVAPSPKMNVGGGSVRESDDHKDVIPGRLMGPNRLLRLIYHGEYLPVEEKLDRIRPKLSPQFVVQVLQRMKNPNDALTFFDWAKRQPGFQHNEYSYSMIISILGRSRSSESLDKILREMYEQGIQINTQIFTALITCYGRAKSLDGALQLFQQMKDSGCKPDTITYTSLIHLLAKHGDHDRANEMFMEMQQVGCAANYRTYSVMIYSLVKSGKVTEAVDLLKQMPDLGCKPSAVTYATVIHHCAKNRQLDLAKDIFATMEREGIKPLKATVIDLDSSLKKAGRAEEAHALVRRLKRQRIWDETYKAPTEKVAQELVFKNFLGSQAQAEAAPVQAFRSRDGKGSLDLTGGVTHQEGR